MSTKADKLGQEAEPVKVPKAKKPKAASPTLLGEPLTFKPFPLELFPESVRVYATEVARSIGLVTAWTGVPFLTVASAAIGNTYRLRAKKGYDLPAVVWATLVAESGSGKSAPVKLMTRPIIERDKVGSFKYQQSVDAYERGGGEGPKPEPVPRTRIKDATIEMVGVLNKNNPRGLLLVKDEQATWYRHGEHKAGEGDVDTWNEIWEADELDTHRITRNAPYVPSAFVSVIGTIQPERLRLLLTPGLQESGFAARVCLAFPPPRKPGWRDEEVSEAAYKPYQRLIERLFTIPLETDADGLPTTHTMELVKGSEAYAANAKFKDEHDDEGDNEVEPTLLKAWEKLSAYALRFALILELVDWAESSKSVDELPKAVSLKSMEGGIQLARWFGHEAKRNYRDLHGSNAEKARDALLGFIERRWNDDNESTTLTIIRRSGPRCLRASRCELDAVNEWLAHLVESGLIESVEPDGKGAAEYRPTQ